jgi:FkbM family methyltransferase
MLGPTLLRIPGARSLADTAVAQRVINAGRAASAVTAPRGFMLDSLSRDRTVRSYRLRAGGRVLVRPGTRDAAILVEIFNKGSYAPPWPIQPRGVMDLGGNIGLFGLYVLTRWPDAEIVSYEPDPANAEILETVAGDHASWRTVRAAVSNHNGNMRFLTGRHSESREALDSEPGGMSVPVVDLFAQPGADLVKIDIEGAEWAILEDPRLSRLAAQVIVLEWHALTCPRPDAGAYARRLLADAGYVRQVEPPHRFDSNGVLWAMRDGH